MADFDAVAPGVLGVLVTERSGATAGTDTVPAGARLLMRNTGAGSHVVTLVTNNTPFGLALADNAITLTAGQIKWVTVPAEFGDANGRVGIGVDGTATEVKYYVLGLG
jgi:hypothetical protein